MKIIVIGQPTDFQREYLKGIYGDSIIIAKSEEDIKNHLSPDELKAFNIDRAESTQKPFNNNSKGCLLKPSPISKPYYFKEKRGVIPPLYKNQHHSLKIRK